MQQVLFYLLNYYAEVRFWEEFTESFIYFSAPQWRLRSILRHCVCSQRGQKLFRLLDWPFWGRNVLNGLFVLVVLDATHGRRITTKWGNLRICWKRGKRVFLFLIIFFKPEQMCFKFGRSMLYYTHGSFC